MNQDFIPYVSIPSETTPQPSIFNLWAFKRLRLVYLERRLVIVSGLKELDTSEQPRSFRVEQEGSTRQRAKINSSHHTKTGTQRSEMKFPSKSCHGEHNAFVFHAFIVPELTSDTATLLALVSTFLAAPLNDPHFHTKRNRAMFTTTTRSALIALLSLATQTSIVAGEPAAAATSPYASTTTGVMKSIGCYSSSGDLTNAGTYEYQTSSHCQATCLGLSKPVLGLTQGGDCWCGDLLPAADTEVSLSECNVSCFGYSEPCKSC